jgi:hypothetical protein
MKPERQAAVLQEAFGGMVKNRRQQRNSRNSLPRLTFAGNTSRVREMAKASKKPGRKALMLGLGLDSDGHKRLTTGPNFVLMGGTEQTHEVMTEKVIKINEKLAARGKQLEDVSREEMDDIAHAVGLRPPVQKRSDDAEDEE